MTARRTAHLRRECVQVDPDLYSQVVRNNAGLCWWMARRIRRYFQPQLPWNDDDYWEWYLLAVWDYLSRGPWDHRLSTHVYKSMRWQACDRMGDDVIRLPANDSAPADRFRWQHGPTRYFHGDEGRCEDAALLTTDRDTITQAWLRDQIALALANIPRMRAFVVRLRYGMDGRGGLTYAEVSKVLGVSRERVRQLEHTAMRLLAKEIAQEVVEA